MYKIRSLRLFLLFVLSAFTGFGQESQKISLPGLKAQVTVMRDGRGIPYIYAQNDDDLYFAQGYVMAGDRLFQMDVMRRLARGETAEIFGASVIEEDKRWRRFGFAEIAEKSSRALDAEVRSALDAYVRGVNAYIDGLTPATLPIEMTILQYRPRHWTAADTIVIGKVLSDALSTTWRGDIMRAKLKNISAEKAADLTNIVSPWDVILFGKDTPEAAAVAQSNGSAELSPRAISALEREEALRETSLSRVGLYAEDLAASNNWVISGKRTADGKALLANDPHLAPTAPGIWYLIGLSSPDIHCAGVTLPGSPGVVLGHNDNIAWGATNVGPDVQDLYEERFNEKGEVASPGDKWETPERRKELIRYRKNPLSPELTDAEFEVVVTPRGPLLIDDASGKYSLRWTALDPQNLEFVAFFKLNRARSWADFTSALRTYGGPTQNFVYADVKGNIGWYAAGKIPIRRTGYGALPYSGSSSDGDWIGYIPFEELPNLYNPESGFIVTANQRIVGTSYKYKQMTHDALSWRARRIFDLLSKNTKISLDDATSIQLDDLNIPLLKFAKDAVDTGGLSEATADQLRKWDGRMTPDSSEALIVNEMRGCAASKMTEGSANIPAAAVREKVLPWAIEKRSSRWLPSGYDDYSKLIGACEQESITSLERQYGKDRAAWTWGKISSARFPHPLGAAPLIGAQFSTPKDPLRGSGQTPNVGSYVSMRLVTTPGNWDATRHVLPLGQSGDPRSPHWKDQFDLWKSGRPAILPFSQAAVRAASVSTVVLSPASK